MSNDEKLIDAVTESRAGVKKEVQADFTIPTYFPLTKKNRQQFRSIKHISESKYYDNNFKPYYKSIIKYLVEYIDFQLELSATRFQNGEISQEEYDNARDTLYNDPQLKQFKESIESLDTQMDNYSAVTNGFEKTSEIVLSREEDELTIENIGLHQNAAFDPISVELEQNIKNLVKINSQNNKNVIELNKIIFVSIFPTRPLFLSLEDDNQHDDDELAVQGGTVDLTCPISREIFEEPVKNKNCGHTYDRESLKVYLQNSISCPECNSEIQMSNIIPDSIMEARVKCHKRDLKLAELVKDKEIDETDKL